MERLWLAFKATVGEIERPSPPGEPLYYWIVIALGHVMLGALFSLVPLHPVWILGCYFLFKEQADLAKGGRVSDSLVDTAFVGLGTMYPGPEWWVVAAFTGLLAGAVWRTL